MNRKNIQRTVVFVVAALAMTGGIVTAPLSIAQLPPSPPAAGTSPVNDTSSTQQAVATLAGGCFWCTEAVFEQMEGVGEVVSGYIGGHVPNPTYDQVCGKQTGHAEAVEIYYDPAKVTFEELLEVFFKTHDPTTMNQQGADAGPQYRSGVFFHTEEQQQVAKKYIGKLESDREFRIPIVTEVTKATRFYEAEPYHQDYFRKNPTAGYCRAVVSKKVRKFNNLFQDKKKQ